MSRSIHSTHNELREAQLRSYRDDKAKAAELAEVEKELTRKRRIKGSISDSRLGEEIESADGSAGPIPVRIVDQGPNILHPATPEDLGAIGRRLPAGIMDGLSEIVLSLGEHCQVEGEHGDIWDPDPVTGRVGHEALPGFYKGWIWGTYQSSACRITLHAVVSDPAKPSPMPTTAYFKLQVLSTFVHEVAHHLDHTRRVARGRWLAEEKEKVEHFALHREHEWTQACVVPYLEEAYPRDVAELLEWLEVHGTIRFNLGELIPDPRRVHVSTIDRAVETLLKDVLQQTGQVDRLFNLAVNLKIADMYERAQEVIDRILVMAPDREDALVLRASTWIFQEEYAQAAALALRVIARNPRNPVARRTLTRAFEGLERWANVIETATESLTLFDERLDRFDAITSRCLAHWRLGQQVESDEDLRTLQSSKRATWNVKKILRVREQTLNQA